MKTDVGARKPGTRMTGAGLFIAGVGSFILAVALFGGGTLSMGVVMIIVAGLIIAGIGFARRVLAALESR